MHFAELIRQKRIHNFVDDDDDDENGDMVVIMMTEIDVTINNPSKGTQSIRFAF